MHWSRLSPFRYKRFTVIHNFLTGIPIILFNQIFYTQTMFSREIYRKGLYLALILATIVLLTTGAAISILYNTAFEEERQRLVETAQSQARLMEAIARHHLHDPNSPAMSVQAGTLIQLREAHQQFKGFGDTGEFTLAKLEKGKIIFLLSHRHDDMTNPRPVDFNAVNAEPMRRALKGLSGSLIGPDYRGELVLAAHEPVKNLNLGVVTKIDLKEIRAPFIRAALEASAIALLLIIIGSWIIQKITRPIQATINTISGIVPICAWCSNQIRTEDGNWVRLESYIEARSEAQFSHSICPNCASKLTKGSRIGDNQQH